MCEIIVVLCVREAAGGEGVPEKEPGIQNQKQEPHTKMWGIKVFLDSPMKNHGFWVFLHIRGMGVVIF